MSEQLTKTSKKLTPFQSIGTSYDRKHEIQALENHHQLVGAMKEKYDKIVEPYFNERDRIIGEIASRSGYRGLSSLADELGGLESSERDLEAHESAKPQAVVIPESEGSAGVFAHLEKRDSKSSVVTVVLSPLIDGHVQEGESHRYHWDRHDNTIYEEDPVTKEMTVHEIYPRAGLGDTDTFDASKDFSPVFVEISQAYLACVAGMEEEDK